MLLKFNFRRLIGLGIFALAVFLFSTVSTSAEWRGPINDPPNDNIAAPLSIDTNFLGDVSGKYDNLKISCNSTDNLFLAWNGSKLVCNNVSTTATTIANYYSSNTTINNPLAGNLLQVLINGADAKNYSGGILIGSSTGTWLNLGGALTAGWLHSTAPGNNTLAGNLIIGPSTIPGLSLQIEKVDTTANIAGKYWSVGHDYIGKELFNILAKVGTVRSETWGDSISGKISFVGVTNNHIPLTDIVFSTTRAGNVAPVEQMRITYAGKLGIGTSSPNSLLHVYNTASNAEIDVQSVAGINNHWGIYQDRVSSELRFWNSQSDNLLSLKKSGIVSIDGSLELINQTPTPVTDKLYNSSGTLYWSGTRIGMGSYIGNTGVKKDGNASSYIGANSLCNSTFAGSRVCFNFEMINSIASNNQTLKSATGVAWVQTGAAGNSFGAANDCKAFQSASAFDYGTIWVFEDGEWGSGYITACDIANNFACCK